MTMGSLKTVPPRMFLMVPLGESHTVNATLADAWDVEEADLTLLQLELLDPLLIRSDGRALDAHIVLENCFSRVDGDLVVGLISIWEAQVIVLQVDVEVGVDELVFDVLPYDSRHLVAIKFHDGVLDLDLLRSCGRGIPRL